MNRYAGLLLAASAAWAQAPAPTVTVPAAVAPPTATAGRNDNPPGSSAETEAMQDNNRRSQCSEGTLPQEPNPPCRLTPDAPTNNASTPPPPPEDRPASPQ